MGGYRLNRLFPISLLLYCWCTTTRMLCSRMNSAAIGIRWWRPHTQPISATAATPAFLFFMFMFGSTFLLQSADYEYSNEKPMEWWHLDVYSGVCDYRQNHSFFLLWLLSTKQRRSRDCQIETVQTIQADSSNLSNVRCACITVIYLYKVEVHEKRAASSNW